MPKKRDANQNAAAMVSAITGMEPPTGVHAALLKRLAAKKLKTPAKNSQRRGGKKALKRC
jgi:hypothetical protein